MEISTLTPQPVTLRAPLPSVVLALAPPEQERERQDSVYRLAAALGACWPTGGPWPGRLRPKPWSPGEARTLLSYGAEVLDSITAPGRQMIVIIKAGRKAMELALESLPSESEVQAAEDFSEAPAGA